MTTPRPPWALLRARPPGRPERVWLAFREPLEILEAHRPEEVAPALERAERATTAGRWVAGFLTYEAAPAFDRAFVTRPATALPLVWLGVFARAGELVEVPPAASPCPDLSWAPSLSPEHYRGAIARIHRLIAAGDTYQVNFTWRLDASFDGDPWSFFHRLTGRSPTDHAAFIDTGRHAVASASPELFFRLEQDRLTGRPMKGTRARGRGVAEDRQRALELFDSPKDRAENLMIVDMIRNDLGRVARTGSVEVESLYDLERHDTVFQLTSTVTARTDAGPATVLAALFPCASVTGAPKVRTMEIIAELEDSPRGVYTGAFGYLAPDGHTEMAVGIRTAWVDREACRARYGTGGGIVWDSVAAEEYHECLAKTRVLAGAGPDFELLETILWTSADGYRLLAHHLERLTESAAYFGFRLSRRRVRGELERLAAMLRRDGARHRVVRLLAGRDGALRLEDGALAAPRDRPWRLALAAEPVDPANRFLFHKTTRREVYERARARSPDADDVLLWNPAGELTESALANVALRHDGVWRTPPVEAGLLAGCERRELIERGELTVATLARGDLETAEEVALLNSVRGWIPVARVVDAARGRLLWPSAAAPERRNPRSADP